MRHIKSEKLKKLEIELTDLEQWLKLGLVPKKDIQKHKDEIVAVQNKISEEKERLHFLKESGDAEEYITPKRNAARTGYTEMPTIPDIDADSSANMTESGFDMESDIDADSSVIDEKDDGDDDKTEDSDKHDDDDDSFSDRNRWKRGGIIDPEANDW